jgi:protein-tyrosine phosphatase
MFEPSLHWVSGIDPHRLALMARPRGGEWLREEVAAWHNAKVNSVVSLLEPHEVRELELKAEPSLCAEHGIEFRSFPIADRGTPSSARELASLLTQLRSELVRGKVVAIHCRAGIGRTGLVAGCLLHMLGVPGAEIFHVLSHSRGVAVPDTSAQAEWVERFMRAHTHQRSNPSIERTSSSVLRTLPAAAHVKR